jgi:hypothetical protein
LFDAYSLLKAKTDSAKKVYNNIPISQRRERIVAFKKWLQLFCETNEYLIEVISYYSPNTAKELKAQLKNYAKIQRSFLTEKYLNSLQPLTDEQIDNHMKKALDDAMKFGKINENTIGIVFIAVTDTLKRVGSEVPAGTEDKIAKSLAQNKPELVRIYRGAIAALESDNPDRYRHCSASMRQIVDKTLGENASERMKVLREYTNSKKEIQLLKALAGLVKSVDEMWNKGVHEEIKPEIAFLTLQATELLIAQIYPFKKRKK